MYWIVFFNFHSGWIGQFFIIFIQPCFCHRGCWLRFLRNQRCNVVFKSSQKCGLTSKWFPNSIPSISRIIKTLYRAQLATVQLCDYCNNQAAQQLQIQRTNGPKFASLRDSGSIHPEKRVKIRDWIGSWHFIGLFRDAGISGWWLWFWALSGRFPDSANKCHNLKSDSVANFTKVTFSWPSRRNK